MLLAVLRSETSGISPEAKYLLIRLAELGLVARGISAGVKELAARFGISDTQTGAALNSLVAAGVLVRRDVVSGQGRPKRHYELGASYAAQVARHDVTEVVHEKIIRHLLQHELKVADQRSAIATQQDEQRATAPLAQVRASRGQGRVSVVNRVLLAALLIRADRFGVVRDLGSAELARITGLSPVRLKNRVGTLLDDGLIRAYTPGATGSVIFKKTKSVYYLNLHHPELSCGQSLPMLLVSVTRVPTPEDTSDQVDYILKSVLESESEIQRRVGVRNFFKDKHERGLAYFLRSRLDFYAGDLLSRHWDEFGKGESQLTRLIELDLLGGAVDAEGSRLLVRYLCEQARNVAESVRANWFVRKSASVTGIDFKAMDYVLLPVQKATNKEFGRAGFYPSRAVLVLPRNGVVFSETLHVVERGPSNRVEIREFTDLAAVSKEEQCLYGLLTPPGGELSVDMRGQVLLAK
jgi:DNA-binding Lrp family transcriptional regulator